ncbi:MAG: hypothetical protein GW762_00595 [Candidatus Pacebacteria bacterium]|nr:hypothetical protein [Candidatus Paceibacterota bacterium]PIR63694.1 MAG: hypothetical protein COU64_03090 [Candidatus Pacebacteria bacterium CG10_big_fil_rev_8_21_14_0_10_40_26]PIZ79697.1 MAG: hypothetical protein COY01_00130 [Candidatus Pacebacteria bacterium CG_4_10_14_0_2_um_filter_40_20]PJA68341.1 MAG: hypothetical protein CO156_05085 [Candidatus Pacebacteria bacterium CG_4_9_14_3_um_filter_40_12]PJC41203.1 MAG: hypothetical protein CO041_05155 [Candidatus Pacebacteria bacterium CG_4_9_
MIENGQQVDPSVIALEAKSQSTWNEELAPHIKLGESTPMTTAEKMDQKRLTKHASKEARKAQREQDRNGRSERWGKKWSSFKESVSGAWNKTKDVVKAIPDVPSKTVDFVEDAYDASATYINGHAVRAVNKVNNVTTNWGDEVTAAANFINSLGANLKHSYNQERLVARADTLKSVANNIVSPDVATDAGAEDQLLAGMDKASEIANKIKDLEDQLAAARAQQGKLKKAGGWLKKFLS